MKRSKLLSMALYVIVLAAMFAIVNFGCSKAAPTIPTGGGEADTSEFTNTNVVVVDSGLLLIETDWQVIASDSTADTTLVLADTTFYEAGGEGTDTVYIGADTVIVTEYDTVFRVDTLVVEVEGDSVVVFIYVYYDSTGNLWMPLEFKYVADSPILGWTPQIAGGMDVEGDPGGWGDLHTMDRHSSDVEFTYTYERVLTSDVQFYIVNVEYLAGSWAADLAGIHGTLYVREPATYDWIELIEIRDNGVGGMNFWFYLTSSGYIVQGMRTENRPLIRELANYLRFH